MHCSWELKKKLFYHPASIILFHRLPLAHFFFILLSVPLSLSLSFTLISSLRLWSSSLSIHSLNSGPVSPFTLSTPVQSLHSLSQLWSLKPTPPKPNVTEAQLRSLNSHWSRTSPKLNSGPLDPRRQSLTSLKLNSGPSTFR